MQNIEIQLMMNLSKKVLSSFEDVSYYEAWCSHRGIIRFISKRILEILGIKKKTQYFENKVFFEIHIEVNKIKIYLLYTNKKILKDYIIKEITSNKLLLRIDDYTIIEEWNLDVTLEEFESTLINYFNKEFKMIVNKFAFLNKNELFIEGKIIKELNKKYERNKNARLKCLELKGNTCCICGINLGMVYGEEFADIIEVHHIIPISKIGKEYIVNPLTDLIPVCPNCHAIIHSKKYGVYTADEVKSMIKFNKKN